MTHLLFAAATSLFTITLLSCGGGGQPPREYSGAAASSSPAAVGNTAAGHDLFQARCSSCHGLDGNAQVNGAANLSQTVMDSFSMAQVIINGRGVMPPFKNALADSDIGHVIVYVRSLRHP